MDQEDGYTLVELLICCVLLVVVTIPVLTVLDRSIATSTADRERALAITEARTGLERMNRELRQAYNVRSWSATGVNVDVVIRGVARNVVFNCAAPHPTITGLKRCTRSTVSGGTPSPARVVLDRLANSGAEPVFELTYAGPSPVYLKVNVKVPARGTLRQYVGAKSDIRLDDGFVLRNGGGQS